LINEMNQTSDADFYIETNLGSFKLPINTLDQFTNDDKSYVQVTIQKVPEETSQNINDLADRNFLELLSEPVDFSVQIVENGTSTTITSYGDQFVERRIPINNPSDAENMFVVLLDPDTQTYQPVPTTIEKDENGQYWAVFYRNGNSIYALAKTAQKDFSDVSHHWAKSNIDHLASKLIVRGISENKFGPDRAVTRAEFATMLTRALGLANEEGSTQTLFKDVQDSDWYVQSILEAAKAGLIKGYDDGTFKPMDTLTREQMTAMAVRVLQWINGNQKAEPSRISAFSDGHSVDDWATASFAVAIDQNLIKGKTKTMLAPKDKVTRAEAAVVIDRLLEKLNFK